jgi:hypothetical protein
VSAPSIAVEDVHPSANFFTHSSLRFPSSITSRVLGAMKLQETAIRHHARNRLQGNSQA